MDNNVMASTSDRSRSRRERTYVGSECAVCEEPLEHTLQGERILQFSCSHVSHEACFYEFIREFDAQYCPTCEAPLHLDTSRGGNVIDISTLRKGASASGAVQTSSNAMTDKIGNIVRSAGSDSRSTHTPTPTWDNQTVRPPSLDSSQKRAPSQQPSSIGRESGARGGSLRDSAPLSDRYSSSRHARSDSEATGATGVTSSGGYPETMQSTPWRHDYDVQAMETTPGSPRAVSRNPIPVPTVTVRSEFPTINRSRQQQTLTCLVTVEVADSKWKPDPEDIGSPAPPQQQQQQQQQQSPQQHNTPHLPQQPVIKGRIDEIASRTLTPASSVPRFIPYESQEVLEEATMNLRNRVDNWHGMDFSRFGQLRLYGTLRVGKDKVSWQELECYLFAEMLICVKEKKLAPQAAAQWDDRHASPRKTTRCTLKGGILIKKHLTEVAETGNADENVLTLSLSVADLPQFHILFGNRNQLKLWNQALLDLNAIERSPTRSTDYERGEFSETDEEAEWQKSGPQRVSSTASSWGHKSATTAPTEYTNVAAKTPNPFASIHVPIDVVVVVPISSSMQGVKINLVRDALKFMVNTLGERDRMGLVTFGSGGGGVPIVGMTTKVWPGWSNILSSIKPVGQKSHRADVVEGANVAMDLLMQRKHNNPIATIMLISDASTADADSVDFVVSRAEAAK